MTVTMITYRREKAFRFCLRWQSREQFAEQQP